MKTFLCLIFLAFFSDFAFAITIYKNPCAGISGTPFRKYAGFSLDASGAVHKHKKLNCNSSPHTSNSYTKIEDFLLENKIIIKEPDGKFVPVCSETVFEIEKVEIQNCGNASDNTQTNDSTNSSNNDDDAYSRNRYRSENNPNSWANPIVENAPQNYYSKLSSQLSTLRREQGWLVFNANQDLKTQLHFVLDNPHIQSVGKKDIIVNVCPENIGKGQSCITQNVFTYKAARRLLFGREDLYLRKIDNEYYLKDVYCNKKYGKNDFPKNSDLPGPLKIPLHEVVNLEHTWPQSKFNKDSKKYSTEMQKTDLHHIFPTDHDHNNMRANYEFANVESDLIDRKNNQPIILKCQGNRIGYISKNSPIWNASNSETIFYEPPQNHKGNIARALFYFSVRYELNISETEEYYLRLWHVEDPIDEEEALQHEVKYMLQGNRNPFIDYPSLVEFISDF